MNPKNKKIAASQKPAERTRGGPDDVIMKRKRMHSDKHPVNCEMPHEDELAELDGSDLTSVEFPV